MSSSDDVAATGSDFGALLAEARKNQNYTVDEVSQQLRIPKNAIIAIEANDISALPAPTYARGYLRSYAKFLEISADKVLDCYNRVLPEDDLTKLKSRPKLRKEPNSQSPLIMLVTAVLAVAGIATILFGIFQYYQEKSDDIETELETKERGFTGDSLDSPGLKKLEIKQAARLTTDGELILDDPNVTEYAVEEMDAAIKPEVDTITASNSPIAAAENASAQDTLKINAEKGSWIEVRDANDVRLFYNMLPEGKTKTLTGEAPFSISLGNAKTTKLIINDLDVDMTKHIRWNNTVKLKLSSEKQKVIIH